LNPAWRAELGRLLPEVVVTGGPAPTDDRLRLFESVAHVVEQLGATQPTVLGLEDLHWADEMSLRLLAFVARRIRAASVLIVATVREDEPASGEVLRLTGDELGREPHCGLLTLSPLSRTDTAALVRTLAQTEGDDGAASWYGLAHALFTIGFVHLCKGDFPAAIPVLEQGIDFCRSRDFSVQMLVNTAILGYTYALTGRLAEGLPLLEQSVQGAERLPLVWSQAPWSTWLAEALLLAGRIDDATAAGRRALDLAVHRKERGQEAYARRLFGEIASHDSQRGVAEAERHYRLAASLAEELGMRPLIAHCHFGLGKLYRRLDRGQGPRSTSRPPRRCTARWTCASGGSRLPPWPAAEDGRSTRTRRPRSESPARLPAHGQAIGPARHRVRPRGRSSSAARRSMCYASRYHAARFQICGAHGWKS
jgi:tetratricopeptide (TPR) repeat protein